MTITLTPEHESIIQAQLATGQFSSVEDVLDKALAPLKATGEAMLQVDGLWVHQGQAEPHADWDGVISTIREDRLSDLLKATL